MVWVYLWISYVGGGGKATLNISDLKCHHVGVGSKLWWQGLAAV